MTSVRGACDNRAIRVQSPRSGRHGCENYLASSGTKKQRGIVNLTSDDS